MTNDDSSKEQKEVLSDQEQLNIEQDEMGKCMKERDEYLNGWKRAKADLLNYQKDESKRFEEFAKFAEADLIRECITVLDSFDLALATLETEGSVMKGIYMIRAQMEDVLKKRGLERIPVNPGETFNPVFHESLGELESSHPPGTIGAVIEQGYFLNGKVVRPARVKLSKLTTNNSQ